MKHLLITLCALLCTSHILAQKPLTTWGDQGNGTFVNPILNADYSDPDIIRVGERYYMVASDFHFIGMQILVSEDMINWKLAGQLYDRFDFPEWERNARYAGGSWAPAIRYHDGKFWVFFCTPNEGLFMTNAEKPEGPWAPLTRVASKPGWEDPCPFWDEDGNAYLGRSRVGAGPIILHRMSPDGTKLLDEGRTVYTGPIAEGTKIHKLNGYYYLSIPEGGVAEGWQTILRSKNIYGPYERKVVLEQGMTRINGPHQGSLVDTPDGEWWFFHFQQYNPLGRVVHLQPVHWREGWPVIGVDMDMNGVGEPVESWRKPAIKKDVEITLPATDDSFSEEELGLQWQFNHNPVNEAWSLTEQKGRLTLHALQAANFRAARNTLSQKSMGYCGVATVKMLWSNKDMADGQRCGLACIGRQNYTIGVMQEAGRRYVYLEKHNEILQKQPIKGNTIYLRMEADAVNNKYQLLYSSNAKEFTALGDPFTMQFGFWKGVRIGLYCYNTNGNAGRIAFDDFVYRHDGPNAKK
jgi:beta-xylosidase